MPKRSVPKIPKSQLKIMMKTLSSRKFRGHKGSKVLKCLVDAGSHKLAQRLYYDYISTENMAAYPKFLLALDTLLWKFGAKTPGKGELNGDDDTRSGEKGEAGKEADPQEETEETEE